jgi:DNA recombination protein RmuC
MLILAVIASMLAFAATICSVIILRGSRSSNRDLLGRDALIPLASDLEVVRASVGGFSVLLREECERGVATTTAGLATGRLETRENSDHLRSALVEGLAIITKALADSDQRTEVSARLAFEAFAAGQKTCVDDLGQQVETLRKDVTANIELWRQAHVREQGEARREQTDALTVSRETIDGRMDKLSALIAEEQEKARKAVAGSLEMLRQNNEDKLEQMRATVQEKLDATLGTRLDASFKVVTERLESVHRGLGEMQTLAQGVGSLQRTLASVKGRGVWGELQLHTLLSDILTPDQYESQCRVCPDGKEIADFAIKMPGGADGQPLRLAIDAKFPMDVYERFCDAYEIGEAAAIKAAGKALEDRVLAEARSVSSKYVHPPFTTDFAVLYLPTEGLFAEVARRPALLNRLRSEYHIIVAGPTTLTALLGSLSMGFRTLAIQKRSSEAWTVLGQVKAEFEKSGDVWTKLVRQLETASKTAESAGTRHRAVARSLRAVESVPLEASVEEALAGVSEEAIFDEIVSSSPALAAQDLFTTEPA